MNFKLIRRRARLLLAVDGSSVYAIRSVYVFVSSIVAFYFGILFDLYFAEMERFLKLLHVSCRLRLPNLKVGAQMSTCDLHMTKD